MIACNECLCYQCPRKKMLPNSLNRLLSSCDACCYCHDIIIRHNEHTHCLWRKEVEKVKETEKLLALIGEVKENMTQLLQQ